MKVTWLGQAGLLFETDKIKIMIDPYLSDSVYKTNAQKFRRIPIKEALFSIKPDMMIFTHNHLDHFDPETVEKYFLKNNSITVLAPASVWHEVRKFGGEHNYVMCNAGTSWTEAGICVTAVKAEHSDPDAIGILIDDGDKKYYVTGDTLYNEKVFQDIPDDIYAVFLPVNGVGNNMNMTDAVRFCERVKPKFAVPIHWGMLDDLEVKEFAYDSSVIPKVYEDIKFKD